jgi:preprotein translocase subunit SecE
MKLTNYFKESYNELIHKVTWPSWDELQGSAIIVMVASIMIALIIALMDLSFKNLMEGIYSLFYQS